MSHGWQRGTFQTVTFCVGVSKVGGKSARRNVPDSHLWNVPDSHLLLRRACLALRRASSAFRRFFSSSGLDKNVYVRTFAGGESKHAFAGSQIDLRCRQCRGLSLRCPVRAAGVFVRGRSGERAGFRASAADALPVLQRLGLAAEGWLWGIESFGRVFRSAIGRAAALTDYAASRGRRWLHGISAARLIFG